MNYILNVTGDRYNNVGFGEAHIFFDIPSVVQETIVFYVWGIDLAAPQIWAGELDLPRISSKQDDVYISGKAQITFTGVQGGELITTLYKKNQKEFLKTEDGQFVRLNKEWVYNHNEMVTLYDLGGVLDWPYSSCSLRLASLGTVSIEFNTDDCISISEYVSDSRSYSYKSK